MGQGKSREIRTKIKSIKNTQKITKAMKLVSASKLRKASAEIDKLRPYMRALASMLGNLERGQSGEASTSGRVCIVVFAGERALCGSFNANAVKNGIAMYEEVKASGQDAAFVAVGKKAGEALRNKGYPVLREFNLKEVLPTVEFSQSISAYVTELVSTQGYARVLLAYTEFKTAMSKKLRQVQYLPFQPSQFTGMEPMAGEATHAMFEPDRESVVEEVRRQLLQGLLHQCYMDSLASEYGSRMVAMDNASRNCKELTYKLTLRLNRERQAAITQEIAEIVGGAAGLQ